MYWLLFLSPLLLGDVRTLSLKEALDLAVRQNPEIAQARLEERRAQLAIRVAKDPFRPKFYAGSGLAYSNGFPMSIEGSAPSILQARAVSSIFNKSLDYRIAQTAEQARTAGIDLHARQENVALQTALLYLDVARWNRLTDTLRRQIEALERADEVVRLRVKEGRELEIEAKRSSLAIAKAKHRLDLFEQERESAEASLANVLGLPATERVRAASAEPLPIAIPETEQVSIEQALQQSRELRRLESAMLAKRHEMRSYQAQRLPSVDLVAQYALFARFNNYEDFFQRFQRHNGQIGISLQVPLFPSPASVAQASQAQTEIAQLRSRVNQTRQRIALDTTRAYRTAKLNERGRELARMDLEIARDQVNILLARLEEGRATLRDLETARFEEQEKWIAYFDAQYAVEKAKLELLSQSGVLLTSLQ